MKKVNLKYFIFVLILFVSVVSVRAAEFEGIIEHRDVEANNAVVEEAFINKFDEKVLNSFYEMESENVLPFAKKVFELTLDDLKKAAAFKGNEDALIISEGKVYFAPDRIRYDGTHGGEKHSVIILVDKQIFKNVMWDQKTYMEMHIGEMTQKAQKMAEKMKEMLGETGSLPKQMEYEKGPKPKLIKTGKTQTINGFVCEEIIAYTSDEAVQAWITQDPGLKKIFSEWEKSMKVMEQEGEQAGVDELIDSQEGMPILKKRFDGSDLSIEEVVQFKRTKVDKNLFEVPADFKKIEMPGLFKFGEE